MKYLKLYEHYDTYYRDFDYYLDTVWNKVVDFKTLDEINCNYYQLTSLKGIEKLVNLQELHCNPNCLTSLKPLKTLSKLSYLNCGSNRLKNLKGIENCLELDTIICSHNELKNLDELLNLPKLKTVIFDMNNLEYPLPIEFVNKLGLDYDDNDMDYFSLYELQKEFLTKFPERVKDLEPIGFNEKIKEEFADIIEGSEFGFFNLK